MASFAAMIATTKDARSANKCAASDNTASEEESVPPMISTIMKIVHSMDAIVRRRIVSSCILLVIVDVDSCLCAFESWALVQCRYCRSVKATEGDIIVPYYSYSSDL